MPLELASDPLALIIKLADRLYFIKSLKYLSDEEKGVIQCARLARISLAIYAPLAGRLGLWQLKSELEDMSFRLLDWNTYKAIANQLAAKKEEREQAVDDIIPQIRETLREYGIDAEITGRAKHIYSIYKKMQTKQLTLEQINDLIGLRIIVYPILIGSSEVQKLRELFWKSREWKSWKDYKETKKANEETLKAIAARECYDIQDIIFDKWAPIRTLYDGEVGRDWIANPKANGYQSLHTTIEINGKIVEIQIRTQEMHETAEYGTAAEHWRYKDPKLYRKSKIPKVMKGKDVKWGEQLVEVRKKMKDSAHTLDLQQQGLLKDRIYVITPQGHVLDFPGGATPLDFAYRIHTDLGHRYMGARVDGRIVRLDYHLNNGEIVELLVSRSRPSPNPDWLDVNKDEEGHSTYIFARVPRTRNKIRSKLRENEGQKPESHK